MLFFISTCIIFIYVHGDFLVSKNKYIKKLVEDYIGDESFYIKENSNNAKCYPSFKSYIANSVIASYTLDNVYTKEIAKAHTEGDIHIHDLGNGITLYCAGHSLRDLLMDGFSGIEGRNNSRPPRHLRSACLQMANYIGTLQMEIAGANAFNSVDTFLAPYVKLLTGDVYAEVKQCIQELVFNLNIPSRAGEIPFSNFSFDWTVPEDMKTLNPVVGGEALDFTYGDCQPELDIINKAFIDVMLGGDANGRNFGFPIPTYFVTPEFFEVNNENRLKLFELTAKYGTPYFNNFINSDLKPTDVRSMCCRLSLDLTQLRKSGSVFNAHDSTGSIGVVTINVPRLVLKGGDYLENLDSVLDLCFESLERKRKKLNDMFDIGMFPYLSKWLPKKFSRHFSTIGINGVWEAYVESNLDVKFVEFAESIQNRILERISQQQENTGNLYNFEEAPAEGACARFAKIDGGKYTYYTQGAKLPFDAEIDVFEKCDIEEPILRRYTGGSVLHIFLGEHINGKQAEALIRLVLENYKIPYFTLTPTFSVCKTHGYYAGEEPKCPKCGAETEVYSRIVGYYSPIKRWNDGKKYEFNIRKLFDDHKIV